MNPISAMKPAVVALAVLALGGCYYSSPYGYAPYYAPYYAPATVSQVPVAPDGTVATPDAPAAAAPVEVAPVYPVPVYAPYPYYYPGWYGCCWPPVAIGFGFRGHFGGGHHHMGGGHWGGGHWGGRPWGGGGHRH
ncbi:hypothetical protein [Burkholderia stagnalis]|uniref:hypothetical protein n=1 Tax=Burkholderia stagnalis TaxID=1503054 RepID=UPI00075B9728|nr:hypothetical protein [Burkholderia stagnalis]KVC57808.1 hypothetical protein WS59_04255 [Burkholderia stagnalis]KVL93989.1 hypothetical protein WT03_16325 [Burkholderia stagnalis]KVM01226.1 hypothetical protein WT02_05870 [Burkholderia stagnalis]KVM02412.1 hypothetical protein WT04_32085 [Burkholderia stagnalis]KVM93103.1 hypothetical protein WT07_30575 [Burkholderia stagnalis]